MKAKKAKLTNRIADLIQAANKNEIILAKGLSLGSSEEDYSKIGSYHLGRIYLTNSSNIIPLGDIDSIEVLEAIISKLTYAISDVNNKNILTVGKDSITYNVFQNGITELTIPKNMPLSPIQLKELGFKLIAIGNNLKKI